MKWKSKDIEAVAVGAQEILFDSAVRMDADEKIGFFRGLTLIPAILEARRNPNDATLKDLVPADMYRRWLVQKKLYLGRETGVESWRPLFAADRLRKAAFDDLKLNEGGVREVIGKLAEKHRIKVTTPLLLYTVKRSEVRTKLKEFSRESLADTQCFATTLDLVEALSDTITEARRAHAWATADLATLDSLAPLPNPYLPCAMAVLGSEVGKQIIPADIREQLYVYWMDAAVKALAANETTLAIVPLAKLTRAGGYLERLRARGYRVDDPK